MAGRQSLFFGCNGVFPLALSQGLLSILSNITRGTQHAGSVLVMVEKVEDGLSELAVTRRLKGGAYCGLGSRELETIFGVCSVGE